MLMPKSDKQASGVFLGGALFDQPATSKSLLDCLGGPALKFLEDEGD